MNITFCINTAKNERFHIELLFKSLYTNLSRRDYPIIVYVENDNQGTTEFLLTQKLNFPNLKIIKNTLPIPIGYARNINLMIEMANTEVVSYLQSDMVIGVNYDIEILKYLTENTVISATRIEPPLHPPSMEKITIDFGLDPQKFDMDAFNSVSVKVKENRTIDYWFAPFTLYKKTWVDIGGHDTLFRRSREDSDLLYRLSMKGIKTIQAWNANVYHFTCTSSRGKEWWKHQNQERTKLQTSADRIEMFRFLRKWPNFKHSSLFNPEKEYKYHISANIINVNDTTHIESILNRYYKFHHIYVDNSQVILKSKYEDFHIPANLLLNIPYEQWNLYKKYYRTWEFQDIFVPNIIIGDDIIIDIDMNKLDLDNPILNVLNDIVHENRNERGTFDCGGFPLTINNPTDHILENIIVKNPPIDDIKFEII